MWSLSARDRLLNATASSCHWLVSRVVVEADRPARSRGTGSAPATRCPDLNRQEIGCGGVLYRAPTSVARTPCVRAPVLTTVDTGWKPVLPMPRAAGSGRNGTEMVRSSTPADPCRSWCQRASAEGVGALVIGGPPSPPSRDADCDPCLEPSPTGPPARGTVAFEGLQASDARSRSRAVPWRSKSKLQLEVKASWVQPPRGWAVSGVLQK